MRQLLEPILTQLYIVVLKEAIGHLRYNKILFNAVK